MGETRTVYPGLVRPYTERSDYVNQQKYTVNAMYSSTPNPTARSCSPSGEHDPFSIYDDDTAHDHYFFLPAGQLEVQPRTKRTCSATDRSGQARWSRSKPLVEKHSKPPDIPCIPDSRTQRSLRSQTFTNSIESTTRCGCPSPGKAGGDVPRPPRNCSQQNNNRLSTSTTTTTRATTHNSSSQRHSPMTKDGGGRSTSLSGDYCSLSAHAVAPIYPMACRSTDAPIDAEKFRKFAEHLIRTDGHQRSATDKNSNDYHEDPTTTARRTRGSLAETWNLNMDKCIDRCTCMLCVKAGRYHWGAGSDGPEGEDTFLEEPCNCVGGRKNIVRRWLCMGVLALFLPCLLCYLPAKLCQKSCRSRHCPGRRLKGDGAGEVRTVVKYVDEGGGKGGAEEVRLQPTGML